MPRKKKRVVAKRAPVEMIKHDQGDYTEHTPVVEVEVGEAEGLRILRTLLEEYITKLTRPASVIAPHRNKVIHGIISDFLDFVDTGEITTHNPYKPKPVEQEDEPEESQAT